MRMKTTETRNDDDDAMTDFAVVDASERRPWKRGKID